MFLGTLSIVTEHYYFHLKHTHAKKNVIKKKLQKISLATGGGHLESAREAAAAGCKIHPGKFTEILDLLDKRALKTSSFNFLVLSNSK